MKLPASVENNKKSLTILAIVVLGWAFFNYGFKPYKAALATGKSKLEQEKSLLIHERDAVETAKQNPLLQVTTDSAIKAMAPKLFEGSDDAIATSELGSYLKDLAYDNKVSLDWSVGPSSSITDGVRNLRVDVKGESDFQGILNLLKALERGDKLVRIERMDLKRTQSGTGAFATPEDFETITMVATISGYAMGELSTAPSAKPGAKAPGTAAPKGASTPRPGGVP